MTNELFVHEIIPRIKSWNRVSNIMTDATQRSRGRNEDHDEQYDNCVQSQKLYAFKKLQVWESILI